MTLEWTNVRVIDKWPEPADPYELDTLVAVRMRIDAEFRIEGNGGKELNDEDWKALFGEDDDRSKPWNHDTRPYLAITRIGKAGEFEETKHENVALLLYACALCETLTAAECKTPLSDKPGAICYMGPLPPLPGCAHCGQIPRT